MIQNREVASLLALNIAMMYKLVFAFGAFMAGLAKFLPYIGPAITWVVMALVTYFQPSTPFELEPLSYMLIVVITTSIIDWFMDNFIVPRIMARTLRVHPAAVLVAAIVAANLRDDGQLIVIAASSAWASRLRYETDTLLAAARAAGLKPVGCRVRVSQDQA